VFKLIFCKKLHGGDKHCHEPLQFSPVINPLGLMLYDSMIVYQFNRPINCIMSIFFRRLQLVKNCQDMILMIMLKYSLCVMFVLLFAWCTRVFF